MFWKNRPRNSVLMCFFLAACNSNSGGNAVPVGVSPVLAVRSVSPAPGAHRVPVATEVSVDFSVPLRAASVTPARFLLLSGANQVAASIRVEGSRATLTPSQPLRSRTRYWVQVVGVEDESSRAISAPVEWEFQTADIDAPEIVFVSPLDGQVQAEVAGAIVASFSEAMEASSFHSESFLVNSGSSTIPGQVSYDPNLNQAKFLPTVPLESNSLYTATIRDTVSDLEGNRIPQEASWSFTTRDLVPPVVLQVTPENGAEGVSRTTGIVVRVSKPLNPGSVNPGTVFLRDENGVQIPGVVGLSGDGTDIDFVLPMAPSPYAMLALGERYRLTVTREVSDTVGNFLAQEFVSEFTTVGGWEASSEPLEDVAEDKQAPQVCFLGATNEFHVAWRGRALGETAWSIFQNKSAPYVGSNASARLVLDVEGGDATSPKIAANPLSDKVVVSWIQFIPGQATSSVVANTLISQIAQWIGPTDLDGNAGTVAPQTFHLALGPGFFESGRMDTVFARNQRAEYGSTGFVYSGPGSAPSTGFLSAPGELGLCTGLWVEFGSDGTSYVVFNQERDDWNLFFNYRLPGENLYDPSRNFQIDQPVSGDDGLGLILNSRLLLLADGRLLVLWRERTHGAGSTASLIGRMRSATGEWGASFDLDGQANSSSWDVRSFDAVASSDGSAHVLLEQRLTATATAGYSLLYRRIDAAGNLVPIQPLGSDPEVYIDPDGSASVLDSQSPKIAMIPNGKIMAVWRQRANALAATPGSICARIKSVGEPWGTILNQDNDGSAVSYDAKEPTLASSPDGTFYLAFAQRSPGSGNNFNIYGWRYR